MHHTRVAPDRALRWSGSKCISKRKNISAAPPVSFDVNIPVPLTNRMPAAMVTFHSFLLTTSLLALANAQTLWCNRGWSGDGSCEWDTRTLRPTGLHTFCVGQNWVQITNGAHRDFASSALQRSSAHIRTRKMSSELHTATLDLADADLLKIMGRYTARNDLTKCVGTNERAGRNDCRQLEWSC